MTNPQSSINAVPVVIPLQSTGGVPIQEETTPFKKLNHQIQHLHLKIELNRALSKLTAATVILFEPSVNATVSKETISISSFKNSNIGLLQEDLLHS